MKLAKQILKNILLHKKVPREKVVDFFNETCYKALEEIHDLILDPGLLNISCINKIAEVFGKLGADTAIRL